MRQNKITILSTAAIDGALLKDAAAKNIVIDVLPYIKTEPILSIEVQQEIEHSLLLSATVVFTSVNAVDAVASQLEGQSPDWQIFCVGHATRNGVEKYFGRSLISGSADNASELAELISDSNAEEVIFFCGDQRRNELPDRLKQNNIDVTEIVVYQTVATPQKAENKYDGVLFFSPSAVQSFFKKNKLDYQTILFAIGNTTGQEIKKFSGNRVLISDVPDKKTLIGNMINYFQTHHTA
jgi:uroporphyrinogen-III synthase